MSLIRLVAWSVLLACGAALSSADSVQAQQKTLKDQLVGAWDTPTTVITRPDGTKFEPFGAARGVSDHRLNWLSRLGHGAHYL